MTTIRARKTTLDMILICTVRPHVVLRVSLRLYARLPGSKNATRFRSVNEFIPHAVWLTSDPTMDRSNCECKYCTKKPQLAISQSLGLSTKRPSSSPVPTQRARRAPPIPRTPYAAVRQPPKPPKPAVELAPAPKQAMALDKDNDIRDTITLRQVQGIRHCRKGELVWCALQTPLLEGDISIAFWPGLIEMVTTKGVGVPLEGDSTQESASAPVRSQANGASPGSSSSKAPEITWKPQQKRSYTVHLLATKHIHAFYDDDVVPYLAHIPPAELVQRIQAELPEAQQAPTAEELAKVNGQPSDFDPLSPANGPGSNSPFKQAVAPFTLALHTASNMARFWTPTDEFELKIIIPPAEPPAPAPSLQNLIEQAARQPSSTPDGAPTPTAVPTTTTRIQYQGLWWGAERIWTEELVRLKLARSQFMPKGSELVFPSAKPTQSTTAWNEQHQPGMPAELTGSAEKGLFMRIDTIFVVEVGNKNGPGMIKECRACGMLYELVDENWSEGNFDVPPHPTLVTNVEKTSGEASTPTKKASKELSRPVLTQTYPLPDPPTGYKFHAILPPGSEVVLSLSLISGRYYPNLFHHPRVASDVVRALATPEARDNHRYLWAMGGLLPGVIQSMDPEMWKPSRSTMFEEAEALARDIFRTNREQILSPETEQDAEGESVSAHNWHDGDEEMTDLFDGAGSSISRY